MSVCECIRVTLAMCVTLVLLGVKTAGGTDFLCEQQCMLRFHKQFSDTLPNEKSSFCCDTKSICEKICVLRPKSYQTSSSSKFNVASIDSASFSPSSVDSEDLKTLKRVLVWCRSCRRKRMLRSTGMREVEFIARSVGMSFNDLSVENSSSGKTEDNSKVKASPPRNLRVVSQSPGQDSGSVQVLVIWDSAPQASGRGLWFLISWVTEGGALRGNLLTNTSSATLSLLPDTVYHIQVSTSRSEVASQWLMVDTHQTPSAHKMVPRPLEVASLEVAVIIVASILVFIIVLLLVSSRQWLRTSSSDKQSDHLPTCNHFKEFPPPVTIQVVPAKVSQSSDLIV